MNTLIRHHRSPGANTRNGNMTKIRFDLGDPSSYVEVDFWHGQRGSEWQTSGVQVGGNTPHELMNAVMEWGQNQ